MEQEINEDVVSLARSVEVGILEVRVCSGSQTVPPLRTVVHHLAPTRTNLRVGELTRDRVGILLKAQESLRAWQDDEARTFLEVEHAEHKARVLIQQALENLRSQKGFAENLPLAELINHLASSDEDEKYVVDVLQATLQSVALAAGIEVGDTAEIIKILIGAADSKLVRKDVDALKKNLAAFGVRTTG